MSGCTYQTYIAKPLDIASISTEFHARDPLNSEFQSYLRSQGYQENQLPPERWDLRALTHSALYFHDDLNVARANWRAALATEQSAGLKPVPGISGDIERHSEHDNGISPWTFGLSIDIPFETGGKRQARIDQASHLSEAARIEIAKTAWEVRSRVTSSWIHYQMQRQQVELLVEESALRKDILQMLETRLSYGMASAMDMSNARLLAQKAQQSLDAEMANLAEKKSMLAHHAGLPQRSLERIQLAVTDSESLASIREKILSDRTSLEQATLTNRLDIRAGLARYAAVEAKLRLEIAKQYPDVILSPGYSYDQGDKILSLGISTLLSLLNRNETRIAEALSQREIEAAKFRSLQIEAIGQMEARKAAYLESIKSLNASRALMETADERLQQSERQFASGQIDRLELSHAKLEALLARQNLNSSEYRAQNAALALEDAMQIPIEHAPEISIDPDHIRTIESQAVIQPHQ